MDDFLANISTTGRLTIGGSTLGNIELPSDTDWFKVSLVAGQYYAVNLEGTPTSAGTLSDPYLRGIYDASGTLISNTSNDDAGVGNNSQVIFTPLITGNYYVAAGAAYSGTGTYKLSATLLTDDFSADINTTGTLSLSGTSSGNIEFNSDKDWFKISLVAGQIVSFTTSAGTLGSPTVSGIYDAAGVSVASGSATNILYTALNTGNYYVSASSSSGTGTGTYQLGATLIVDDFSANINTTGTLTNSTASTGTINFNGDTDWFKVSLVAGQYYAVNLEGTPTSAGTLSDPYLRGIYDASGTLISNTSNDDAGVGNNSQVIFTPLITGNYYVAAGASGLGTGTYQLNLDTPPSGSATAHLVSGTQGIAYTINATDLLQGFSDAEYDVLSINMLTVDHGNLTNNLNGTWSLPPNNSNVVNLSYSVSDGKGGVISATQQFTQVSLFGSSLWYGTNLADDFHGSNGNDNMYGRDGDDRIFGSLGNDKLDGGLGNDTLYGESGVDILNGGAGDDSLDGGIGADSMTGGNGADTYYVDNVGDIVTETNANAVTGGIDLVNSTLVAYTLGSNVENGRIMSTGDANLTGNNLNNLIYAGTGVNVIDGLDGVDTLSYQYATSLGTTGITLKLSVLNVSGQATASGISGADLIKNIENITGSDYNDNLTGTAGANTLIGGNGNDLLFGAAGNDSLNGGAGADTLVGGAGKDLLTGAAGNDIFKFNALSELGFGVANRDVITDFAQGQDKIDLSTIDTNLGIVKIAYSNGIVSISTDANLTENYEIQLTGSIPLALTGSDFIL